MTEENPGLSQSAAQVSSIQHMVAALHVDYDRLDELRADRERIVISSPLRPKDAAYKWRADYPEDNIELEDLEEAAGGNNNDDDAREQIYQDPLSIQVRDGWRGVGQANDEGPNEFEILLCTGGPAVRILGEFGEHCSIANARIQHQDWFVPWTDYSLTDEEREAVLAYCQVFNFEE
jgi:hypothetical protein